MRVSEEQKQIQAKGLAALRRIDKKYNPGSRWIARQLNITYRQIPRWRKGHNTPGPMNAIKLMILAHNIEAGRVEAPNWKCEAMASLPKNKKKFKGVFYHPAGVWQARYNNVSIGTFPTPEQAALRYNLEVEKLGECAYLNDLPDMPRHRCDKCGKQSRLCCRFIIWEKAAVVRKYRGEKSSFEKLWLCMDCRETIPTCYREYDRGETT